MSSIVTDTCWLTTERTSYAPLERCLVRSSTSGTLVARDGRARIYHRGPCAEATEFVLSGACGSHLLTLEDSEGRVLASAAIQLQAETAIEGDEPMWAEYLAMLRWNCAKGKEFTRARAQGRVYELLSYWLRDHVFILKGKRYLSPNLVDAIDLFARYQRADGMLYDFYMPHVPGSTGHRDRFREDGWVRVMENGTMVFQRVPLENDVEFLFVLGVHLTWQATGDDAWMAGKLDSCIRALDYARTDPLRWSAEHGLLKRGFTLDTWDFQPSHDARLIGDTMDIDGEETRFCIFHGDNTGVASSSRLLSEMLGHAGRADEAPAWRDFAHTIQQRINALSWTGSHYRHMVDEGDPAQPVERGLRVLGDAPRDSQVSLSNALALHRDIDQQQADAIIASYRRIADDLPDGTPGEFVALHPPFVEGFGMRAGEYVNGAVFPFIGGELAHGAFRRGHSAYGADLVQRLYDILVAHDGDYPYYYLVDQQPRDPGTLRPVDIRGLCNAGFGGGTGTVPQWSGEGDGNDLAFITPGAHSWHGIPGEVVDPASNGGAGCIGLHPGPAYLDEVTIPLTGTAGAFYLHHTACGGADPLGWVDLHYADGSSHRIFVRSPEAIGNWWNPIDCVSQRGRPYTGFCRRVAVEGRNTRSRVGTYLWGFDNPHPDKPLSHFSCTHSGLNAHWFILGLTIGSGPRWLGSKDAITGHLENWNASAVLQALIEGQAGIRDEEAGMRRVSISPRWIARDTRHIRVCGHYPAGDGYVAYDYQRLETGIHMRIAANGDRRRVRVLLPEGVATARIHVDDAAVEVEHETVGAERYACCSLDGLAAVDLAVDWDAGA